MTYQQLLDYLDEMTPEQLAMEVICMHQEYGMQFPAAILVTAVDHTVVAEGEADNSWATGQVVLV